MQSIIILNYWGFGVLGLGIGLPVLEESVVARLGLGVVEQREHLRGAVVGFGLGLGLRQRGGGGGG